MGSRHPFITGLLVTLLILDVATDIGTGVELILNDHYEWGYAVIALVALPEFAAIIAELLRGCLYSGCCGEASTDWIPLIFYHLYTIIITIGSDCQPKWTQESHYLRAIQGFLQSGLQFVLQLTIVFKGILIHSFRDLLRDFMEHGLNWNVFADKPLRWYWGLIQLFSLAFSAVSFLQTCIHFNEWPKRRHTIHRLLVVVPFFMATFFYRATAIAFLAAFAGQLAFAPLTALITAQIITFGSLGLDLPRSIVYGFCSLLAPVGYGRSRDPYGQPFGITLLPGYMNRFEEGRNVGEGDRSPEEVEMLRERSKNFMAMHVILGGGVLGISCAIIGLLINFTNVFTPLADWIIFDLSQLNGHLLPVLAISYITAALLTAIFSCCIGRCFEEEYIYPV